MVGLRRKVVAVLAAAVAVGATAPIPAASATQRAPVRAVVASTCSSGYTRAVINGSVKCLRRGEFCTHSADRQYRRYGFRCTRYYPNVRRYRLT